jgi:hypothetical protein
VADNFAAQSSGAGSSQVGLSQAGVSRGGVSQSSAPDVLAEYRLDARYRRPFLSRFAISGVVTCLFALGAAKKTVPELLIFASLFGAVAVYSGIVYIWRDRFRTRVTTQGIEIRGYFNHFVPWSEIKGITEEGYGGSQSLDAGYDVRVRSYGAASRPVVYRRGGGRMSGSTTGRRARLGVVRIVRHRGKSLMLRAPLVTAWAPDPYFETKLRQMQQLSGQYGTRPIGG